MSNIEVQIRVGKTIVVYEYKPTSQYNLLIAIGVLMDRFCGGYGECGTITSKLGGKLAYLVSEKEFHGKCPRVRYIIWKIRKFLRKAFRKLLG